MDKKKEDSENLPTWAEQSKFRYEGSVKTGALLLYGTGSLTKVTASDYDLLLKQFKGKRLIVALQ